MSVDRPILVAWDGSPAADQALAWAAGQARATRQRAVVVHVVDPGVLDEGARDLPPEIREDSRAAAERMLTGAALDATREQGLLAEVDLVCSKTAPDAILDAIRRHDAAIVVLGTRGQGVGARFVLGSVADRVARISEVPVVLIRA